MLNQFGRWAAGSETSFGQAGRATIRSSSGSCRDVQCFFGPFLVPERLRDTLNEGFAGVRGKTCGPGYSIRRSKAV
jgi:hypothetical protein